MPEPSSDKPIHEELIETGLQQGSLLPLLPYLVLFSPDDRVTSISKPVENLTRLEPSKGSPVPPHAYGASVPSKPEKLVVISQTCDVQKPTNVEPCILAARAFVTGDAREIAIAQGGSVRRFILRMIDGNKALIVDPTIAVLIEKPVLRGISHEFGPADASVAANFRRWLGQRFGRPDFPTGFVEAVVDPMTDKLVELARGGDARVSFLKNTILRVVMPGEDPPYDCSIVALLPKLPEEESQVLREKLAALLVELLDAVDKSKTSRAQVDFRSISEFGTDQFLSTEPFPLGGS